MAGPVHSTFADTGRPEGGPVAVALSGGVDSAVAAALLKSRGYEVFGLTMRLLDDSGTIAQDAAEVARVLGIGHHVIDLRDVFSREVISPFAEAYVQGLTPLPCALCNRSVKLGRLLEEARALGADRLATGHYAKLEGPPGDIGLWRARDESRDQSYFLFTLPKERLPSVMFPLGDFPSKARTRELARSFNIPVHERADSQDLCFSASGRHADLVMRLRADAVRGGDIVDETTGKVVGHHRGLLHYTVGQRRGLGLGGRGDPLYVTRLEAPEDGGRVFVGPAEKLERLRFDVLEPNWLGEGASPPSGPFRVFVKIRNLSPLAPARVLWSADGTRARVEMDSPLRGVAPGQAAVFYDCVSAQRVLGGGWIARTSDPQ
ncbi:tRNA 2-thiouridine(34) synthase MnmA [Phaeovibrio sulfidiphilus]|uniref:tRNA-specific 2-thiouridylase MnmA n=1 Tax=Phaeovibrio sulfidiphilus TaxID=1220600 RepID=A0A8J6YWH3_9PROT|nr:tRNA 2-thiouridine(34) synthase MnmA [Phaeovibrio sulfidiphilus]MBE1236957.1 tRNA 2-thiouridine(34) synthase MnmA [Phaeovibrio sulfidiphilus]